MQQREGNPWGVLKTEVDRLTTQRPRGVNFSEDFAVDRVCAALAKLQQRYGAGRPGGACSAVPAGSGELAVLQVELRTEEQRLSIQQAKIDEARLAAEQARFIRTELENELEQEETMRRRANEAQAKQWREAALKTHLCLASIRAKEQERAQLQTAVSTPQTSLGEVRDGIVKKMQAELDKMRGEEVASRRELEEVATERAHAEVAARPWGVARLDASLASRGAGAGGNILDSVKSLQAPVQSPHAATFPSSSPLQMGTFVQANSTTTGTGLAEPSSAAPIGRPAPAVVAAASVFAAPEATIDRGPARDELMRIAARASDNAKSLQAAMAGVGAQAGRVGGAPASPIGPRFTVPMGFSAPAIGTPQATPVRQQFVHDPHTALAMMNGAPVGVQKLSVLDEAQRVLEKMDSLNARRGPSISFGAGPHSTLSSAAPSPMVTTFANYAHSPMPMPMPVSAISRSPH